MAIVTVIPLLLASPEVAVPRTRRRRRGRRAVLALRRRLDAGRRRVVALGRHGSAGTPVALEQGAYRRKGIEVGVRQEERRGVLVHERVVGRQLQVGHAPRDLAYLAARIDGQQGDVGAEGAGVAQEPEALDGQVGQQTDLDGLLDVDELAERSADQELLDVGDVDPDAAAQHGETGVHGRLRAQQAVDVGLGQDDVATVSGLGRPGDHVLEAVLRLPDAGRVEAAGEASALEQRSGHEQLGQHVDQAATAQTLRGGVVDDAEARFERAAVDPDVLDRAGRGPHPAGHAGALEGRTGRAGAADQPLAVAEHDLAVGAYVHE